MIDTSVDAYREAVYSGIISKRRFQIIEVLYKVGKPLTTSEVFTHLIRDIGLRKLQQNSITPRFVELERLGIIEKLPSRPCSITSILCHPWELTGRIPGSKKERSELLDKGKHSGKSCLKCYQRGYRDGQFAREF